jgi:putative PIN family toxin of toxin-antitoxin system
VRAVFDANVLISGFLWPEGAPGNLVSRWLVGEIELVVSDGLIADMQRALGRPKLRYRVTRDEESAIMTLLRTRATVAADPLEPARYSADPDDDYLVALAEAQRAVLVSGDRHLLELADRYPILSPRAFLTELE